ncbi:TPA: hypothetical protein UMZ03_000650 [Stenotrophomonas maltophilia]|nr:hypothetical protein [Stenotrophomonas maltophilia]HDX0923904.1 hypothetical protein [Stenotrophomonas maltophilia]HEL3849962.1 hypothetical protein [Stenotrophomonas maltophilia]HEL4772152.1 hypothetical protein [Stenotrophomonas maltophilia]HEL7749083.1 hypothetical protein [Stenotrophomonas maltophilia]
MVGNVLVTVDHARAAKLGEHSGVLCAAGIRTWMDRHGLDLRQFLDDGLPVEQFEALDDAFAQRLAVIAREEASRG